MKYMPQEIEVWYVIPAIRRDLAKSMLKSGLRQKDIAKALGLTEPAVSQYLKSKRGKDVKFPKGIKDMIVKAADIIMKNDKQMMAEVQKILTIIRKEGLLCKIACIHKDIDCKVCLK